MDVQLKELIEKVKNDGVKSAEEKAAAIVAEAEEKAAAIVKKAQEEAALYKENARRDAEKMEQSGREALKQAGRDLVLTVRKEIESIFNKIIREKAAAAFDAKLMGEAVSYAVKALAGDSADNLDVLIPEKTFNEVEKALKSELSAEISSGMDIKPFKGLDAGFRISSKDGSVFYDFSDKEIAAMLGRFLNPRLSDLLSD